jgi:hypothetical protein
MSGVDLIFGFFAFLISIAVFGFWFIVIRFVLKRVNRSSVRKALKALDETARKKREQQLIPLPCRVCGHEVSYNGLVKSLLDAKYSQI